MYLQDKLSPEEAKDILTDIVRSAECPVCLTSLRPPDLVQCSEGHVTCTPCRTQLDSCSICSSHFTTVRPLTLCQLLESLPRFCKHEGCERRLQARGHRESWCVWSATTCKFLVDGVCCDAVVPCKDLLKHLEEQHQQQPIVDEDHWKCLIDIENLKENTIIHRGVFLFWVMYSFENDGSLKVMFKIIPNSDLLVDFVTASIRVRNAFENVGIMKYKRGFCSSFFKRFDAGTITFILSQTDIKFINGSIYIGAKVSIDKYRWDK